MNTTLKLIAIFGMILFGILFSVTFISPDTVEESTKGFVKSKIEQEVRTKYKAMKESSVTNAALEIAGKLGLEKEMIQVNGIANAFGSALSVVPC